MKNLKLLWTLLFVLGLMNFELTAQEAAPPVTAPQVTKEKAAELPAVPQEAKLRLRDIQVQYFSKEQQITALESQKKSIDAQIAEIRKQESEQINPMWQAEVAKDLTEMKLDPATHDIEAGLTEKDIKAKVKEKK